MKVTQMPPVHAANLVTNCGNTAYGVDVITPTPYMVLPLFATRFAAYAGGIRVSFIQPRLF